MNYPPNPNGYFPPDQNPYNNPYFQPMPPPREPKEPMGTGIWKVLVIQLPAFLFYDLLMMAGGRSTGIGGLLGPLAILIFPLYWLFLLIMMIVSFSTGKTGRGLGYLISLLATLIIGLGSCAFYLD